MKLFFKITGIIVAIVIVAVISLAVVAHFVITPERVRARVIPLAENALNRKVDLKEIKISVFSGITLTGFAIAEADGKTPFVSADAAVLKYKLMPLLRGQVEVNEIGLSQPTVRVVRNPDGTFNFSDLIPAAKQAEKKDAKASKPAGQKVENPLALLVSKAVISGGDIEFIDRATPGKIPFSLHITGIDLRATDISLDKSFPFTFKADLNGKRLSVAGLVNPATSALDAKIGISGFPITDFEAYFNKAVPGKLESAELRLDIAVKADPQKVASSGLISLENIGLKLDAVPDARLEHARVALDYDVGVDLKASSVILKRVSLDVNGIKVNAKGGVTRYDKAPVLDMGVTLPDTNLADLLKALPAGISAKVKDFSIKGRVGAEAHIAGDVSSPRKLLDTARISMDSVSAKAGGLAPVLSGKITARGDSVNMKGFMIKMGKDQIAVDLDAKNLMARPVIVKSTITSDHIDVDALMAAAGKSASPSDGAAKPDKESTSAKKRSEIGPFDIPVTADAEVRIAHAIYKGLDVSDVHLLCRLDKNIFYLENLAAGVAGGTIAAGGQVDLARKGLMYNADLKVKGVSVDPCLAAFVPAAKGTVFGSIDLTTSASGEGTDLEAIKKNLSSNADVRISDGRVTGQGLASGLADFFNTEKLKVINFSKFAGQVKISNGKARIDSDFSGHDVRMLPKGNVGLDGALDLVLDLRLAPDLAKKIDKGGSATKFLSDNSGWSLIPLKLGGTFSAPRFSLDTAAVTQQVKQKAVTVIEDKIKEKLLKKYLPESNNGAKKGDSGDGQGQDPAGKLIDNALKGFFGK